MLLMGDFSFRLSTDWQSLAFLLLQVAFVFLHREDALKTIRLPERFVLLADFHVTLVRAKVQANHSLYFSNLLTSVS